MKHYLLMTTCSRDADGITWGCDLAVLRVDQPFLTMLRHRVALLREAYAQDGAVHELSFWASSQVAFYDQSAMDGIGLSAEDEAFIEGDSFVFLDCVFGDALPADTPRERSVELAQLTVRLSASVPAGRSPLITVLWSTVPRHTGASVVTAHVPVEQFGL